MHGDGVFLASCSRDHLRVMLGQLLDLVPDLLTLFQLVLLSENTSATKTTELEPTRKSAGLAFYCALRERINSST